jgi:transglutaminase-like putative cysteine protease
MVAMAKLANEAQFDVAIRSLTEQIVKGLFPHDYLSEYVAILCWIRMNIRYVRDPVTIEQVKTPRAVIETESADCDEMGTLAAAMVGTIGGKSRFVAATFNSNKPLTHVWAEAFDPGTKAWVILDPVPGRRVGQMVGRIVRTMVHPGVQ